MQERGSPAAFIVGIGVAGWSAASAFLLLQQPEAPSVPLLITLGLMGALAIYVPIRFEQHGESYGFDLQEAVFVAAALVLPLSLVPLLMAAAALVGYSSRVRSAQKTLFNTGQVALWSSAAAATMLMIGRGPSILHPRTLAAVAAAVLVLNLVSLGANAELFRRLIGRPWRDTFKEVWLLNSVTLVGNTSFGLILAIVAIAEPWATLLASTLMVGLYLGYRGYVGVIEERQRTDALHAVTRTLVEATGRDDALERFLGGLTRLLGAQRAELVLATTPPQVLRMGPDGVTTAERPSHELAEALRRGTPLRFDGGDGGIPSLTAPLSHADETIGAVGVFDRRGLEPWDDTDRTLLASVANEAAVAIKNVELFRDAERERARWEAESTKLGDIVNAASDGIWMLTEDGTIGAWNDAMAEITGTSAAQAIGNPWFVVLRLRDEQDNEILPDAPEAGPITSAIAGTRHDTALALQVLRRDGTWRWLRATFAPVLREDATPVGTVVVARDVTREREVEEMKADFVATVSHELRTPMTPLKGFLATLIARGDEMGPDQKSTILDGMAGQLRRLERLIADLLVVADLDRGSLEITAVPVELGPLVSKAIQDEGGDRIQLELRDRVTAAADQAAAARVVDALLSNALKHTEGPIRVTVDHDGSDGVVRIQDEGPGIAPWEQARIFQRFHRLGEHLTRTQGPGLGLPIARALAEQMGGSIELHSDVGVGSTFTLRLPTARPRSVRAERASRA